MTRAYAADAIARSGERSRRALCASSEGTMLEAHLAAIAPLFTFRPFDPAALRETVVRAAEEAGGYPLRLTATLRERRWASARRSAPWPGGSPWSAGQRIHPRPGAAPEEGRLAGQVERGRQRLRAVRPDHAVADVVPVPVPEDVGQGVAVVPVPARCPERCCPAGRLACRSGTREWSGTPFPPLRMLPT